MCARRRRFPTNIAKIGPPNDRWPSRALRAPSPVLPGAIAGAPRLPAARRPLGSRHMRGSRGGKKHPAAGQPLRVAGRHGSYDGCRGCYKGATEATAATTQLTPRRPQQLLLRRLRPRARSRRLRAQRRPLPGHPPRLPRRPPRLRRLLRRPLQRSAHHHDFRGFVCDPSVYYETSSSSSSSRDCPYREYRGGGAALCTRMTDFRCVLSPVIFAPFRTS